MRDIKPPGVSGREVSARKNKLLAGKTVEHLRGRERLHRSAGEAGHGDRPHAACGRDVGFVEVERRRWDYNPANPTPPRGAGPREVGPGREGYAGGVADAKTAWQLHTAAGGGQSRAPAAPRRAAPKKNRKGTRI